MSDNDNGDPFYEFIRDGWAGCMHLDCLPRCSMDADKPRCARFDQAYAEWRAVRDLPIMEPSQ